MAEEPWQVQGEMIGFAVGQILREARKGKGHTQEEVAWLAGISQAMLSHIESGNRNVRLNVVTLYKVAKAVGIRSLSQLMEMAESEASNDLDRSA
ncbi:MAG: helix-turn-helix domain-containing protein [Epibacterium sp.]|nr:helix-turn-helix domain-containing protein [Epibacterium sp.]NQX73778.1 helix-turn-helix transcriptional regulator [Epibacterium sp.]